ncbi:MAG: CtsR family transcriptional regulator [Ruminococcaceae bacterium]|nr:CtsR family transcriptional regulator [Oscillospiraceae bacterium]
MNISDLIESFIVDKLNEQRNVELKRNELASTLGCVPSQINYVISTRFTTERGYIVESRRGGGGYIKISRVVVPEGDMLMHIINSIGDAIDQRSVAAILSNLVSDGFISEKVAKIIMSACSDKALMIIALSNDRNRVRASIFKNILISLV